MNPAQQIFCRAAFVLFCLCPTLAVAGWIVQRSLPGAVAADRDEWRRELSQRLGCAVECERVEYPSFDVAALLGVVLRDEESGAVLAQCPAVELTRRAEGGFRIDLFQPVLESVALPRIHEALETRLLRAPQENTLPCELRARDLTLRSEQVLLTWRVVEGAWTPLPSGPELTLALHPAAPAAGPARLVVTRNRSQTPAVTRWQWLSGGNAVPVRLLANTWPELSRLGEQAWAQVDLEYAGDGAGAVGSLRGAVSAVDLTALVTEQFPHQLSGLAEIKLSDALFVAGRLVKLRGSVQARDGWVSPSLLAAAQQELGLSGVSVDATSPQNLPYRWLSVGFDLREEGLVLTGGAEAEGQQVLLANAAEPLLAAPVGHRAPAAGVAAALAPGGTSVVPTRAAQAVARWLPLSANAAQLSRQHIPTRLAPPREGPAPVTQPR